MSGLPQRVAALASDPDALRAHGSLQRRDTAPILAQDAQVFVGGDDGVIVEYSFLRNDPITLEDEHVEFVATLGRIQVRRRFELSDMLFEERLVL